MSSDYLGQIKLLIYEKNKGNNIIDDEDCKLPSPDLIYDPNEKRIDTRETRFKDGLIRERNDLIEECMRMR